MKQKELIQRKLGLEGIEGNLERNFLSHVSVELLLGKLAFYYLLININIPTYLTSNFEAM